MSAKVFPTGRGIACVLAALALGGGLRPLPGEEPSSGDGEPSLEIVEPDFDWGQAYQGQIIERTFTIRNAGRGTLVIEEVKPNCGCTVLGNTDMKKSLLPGESTPVCLLLDTTTLRPGRVKKDADILSNAASGENRIFMQGEVRELLLLEPALPEVQVVRDGPTGVAPTLLEIRPGASRSFRILSVAPTKGILEPKLEAVDEANSRYRVALVARLRDTSAFQTEVLEFQVKVDRDVLPIRVQVGVVLKDRIEVLPSKSVYFHRKDTERAAQAGAAKATKELELASLGGAEHRFRVKSAKSVKGIFLVQVETVDEGKRYRLKITLEKTPATGVRFLKDTIELETDDASVPAISIPAMAQF